MRRWAFFLGIFCLLAWPVQAQVTTTGTVKWHTSDTLAVASGLQSFFGEVGKPLTVKLTQTCVAAVAPATGADCTSPIPAKYSDNTTVLVAGRPYALIVTDGILSATSDPVTYSPGAAPGKPSITIITTTTIVQQ